MLPHVTFQRAETGDVDRILAMYHQSFRLLYTRYHDESTNPYCESATALKAKLNRPGSYYYFVFHQATVVGLIRLVINTGLRGRISPLLILPEFQGHHFAEAALKQAEWEWPAVQAWSVDTIEQEAQLIHLYTRMGYVQVAGKRTVVAPGMTIVYFEKRLKRQRAGVFTDFSV